jgi:SNF2 family DNA or RNA helicase
LLHQAADRTYRISQHNAVTVDLLTIKGSIDSLILHKILTKEQVIDQIIKESKIRTVSTILNEIADIMDENHHEASTP